MEQNKDNDVTFLCEAFIVKVFGCTSSSDHYTPSKSDPHDASESKQPEANELPSNGEFMGNVRSNFKPNGLAHNAQHSKNSSIFETPTEEEINSIGECVIVDSNTIEPSDGLGNLESPFDSYGIFDSSVPDDNGLVETEFSENLGEPLISDKLETHKCDVGPSKLSVNDVVQNNNDRTDMSEIGSSDSFVAKNPLKTYIENTSWLTCSEVCVKKANKHICEETDEASNTEDSTDNCRMPNLPIEPIEKIPATHHSDLPHLEPQVEVPETKPNQSSTQCTIVRPFHRGMSKSLKPDRYSSNQGHLKSDGLDDTLFPKRYNTRASVNSNSHLNICQGISSGKRLKQEKICQLNEKRSTSETCLYSEKINENDLVFNNKGKSNDVKTENKSSALSMEDIFMDLENTTNNLPTITSKQSKPSIKPVSHSPVKRQSFNFPILRSHQRLDLTKEIPKIFPKRPKRKPKFKTKVSSLKDNTAEKCPPEESLNSNDTGLISVRVTRSSSKKEEVPDKRNFSRRQIYSESVHVSSYSLNEHDYSSKKLVTHRQELIYNSVKQENFASSASTGTTFSDQDLDELQVTFKRFSEDSCVQNVIVQRVNEANIMNHKMCSNKDHSRSKNNSTIDTENIIDFYTENSFAETSHYGYSLLDDLPSPDHSNHSLPSTSHDGEDNSEEMPHNTRSILENISSFNNSGTSNSITQISNQLVSINPSCSSNGDPFSSAAIQKLLSQVLSSCTTASKVVESRNGETPAVRKPPNNRFDIESILLGSSSSSSPDNLLASTSRATAQPSLPSPNSTDKLRELSITRVTLPQNDLQSSLFTETPPPDVTCTIVNDTDKKEEAPFVAKASQSLSNARSAMNNSPVSGPLLSHNESFFTNNSQSLSVNIPSQSSTSQAVKKRSQKSSDKGSQIEAVVKSMKATLLSKGNKSLDKNKEDINQSRNTTSTSVADNQNFDLATLAEDRAPLALEKISSDCKNLEDIYKNPKPSTSGFRPDKRGTQELQHQVLPLSDRSPLSEHCRQVQASIDSIQNTFLSNQILQNTFINHNIPTLGNLVEECVNGKQDEPIDYSTISRKNKSQENQPKQSEGSTYPTNVENSIPQVNDRNVAEENSVTLIRIKQKEKLPKLQVLNETVQLLTKNDENFQEKSQLKKCILKKGSGRIVKGSKKELQEKATSAKENVPEEDPDSIEKERENKIFENPQNCRIVEKIQSADCKQNEDDHISKAGSSQQRNETASSLTNEHECHNYSNLNASNVSEVHQTALVELKPKDKKTKAKVLPEIKNNINDEEDNVQEGVSGDQTAVIFASKGNQIKKHSVEENNSIKKTLEEVRVTVKSTLSPNPDNNMSKGVILNGHSLGNEETTSSLCAKSLFSKNVGNEVVKSLPLKNNIPTITNIVKKKKSATHEVSASSNKPLPPLIHIPDKRAIVSSGEIKISSADNSKAKITQFPDRNCIKAALIKTHTKSEDNISSTSEPTAPLFTEDNTARKELLHSANNLNSKINLMKENVFVNSQIEETHVVSLTPSKSPVKEKPLIQTLSTPVNILLSTSTLKETISKLLENNGTTYTTSSNENLLEPNVFAKEAEGSAALPTENSVLSNEIEVTPFMTDISDDMEKLPSQSASSHLLKESGSNGKLFNEATNVITSPEIGATKTVTEMAGKGFMESLTSKSIIVSAEVNISYEGKPRFKSKPYEKKAINSHKTVKMQKDRQKSTASQVKVVKGKHGSTNINNRPTTSIDALSKMQEKITCGKNLKVHSVKEVAEAPEQSLIIDGDKELKKEDSSNISEEVVLDWHSYANGTNSDRHQSSVYNCVPNCSISSDNVDQTQNRMINRIPFSEAESSRSNWETDAKSVKNASIVKIESLAMMKKNQNGEISQNEHKMKEDPPELISPTSTTTTEKNEIANQVRIWPTVKSASRIEESHSIISKDNSVVPKELQLIAKEPLVAKLPPRKETVEISNSQTPSVTQLTHDVGEEESPRILENQDATVTNFCSENTEISEIKNDYFEKEVSSSITTRFPIPKVKNLVKAEVIDNSNMIEGSHPTLFRKFDHKEKGAIVTSKITCQLITEFSVSESKNSTNINENSIVSATATAKVLPASNDRNLVVSDHYSQEIQNGASSRSNQLPIDSGLSETNCITGSLSDTLPEKELEAETASNDQTEPKTNLPINAPEKNISFQENYSASIETITAAEKACSPAPPSDDKGETVSHLNSQEIQNDSINNRSDPLQIDSGLSENLCKTGSFSEASPKILLKTASTRSDDTKSITNVCNNEQELTESFQGTLDTTIEAASANEKVSSPLQISGDQESVVSQLNAQEVQNDFVGNGSEQLLIDSVLPEKLDSTPLPVDASPEIVLKTASTRSDDTKSITNVCNNEQELTESFQGTLDTTIEAASANEKVCSPLQISGDQEAVVSQLNAQEVQNDFVGNGSEQLLIDSVLPEKLDSTPLPVDASPEIVLKTASTRSDDTKSITNVCNNEQELTESFQGTLDTTIEAGSANEKVSSTLQISEDQESVVSQLNAQEVQNDCVGNGSKPLLIDSVLPEKLDGTTSPVDVSPMILLKTASTRSDDTKSISNVCNNEQELTESFQGTLDTTIEAASANEKVSSPLQISGDQESVVSQLNAQEVQNDFVGNGSEQLLIDSVLPEKLDSTPLPVDASPEIVLKTASTRSDDTKSITNVCNNEQELTESFQGTLDTTIEAASANEEVSSPLQISGDQESVVSQLNAQEVQNDFVGNGSEQLLIDSVLPEKLDSTPLPVDASPEIVLKTASTRSDDTKSITNVCNNEQELTESFQGTLDTTIEAASANEKVCSPLQISGDQEAVVSQLNAQEVQNDFVGNGSEPLLIDSVLPEKLDGTTSPVDVSPMILLKTASTRSDDTKSISNVCNNEQELTESFQGTLDTTIEAASANEKVSSPLQISGDQESVVSQLNAQEVQNDFVGNGSEQLLIDSVLPEKLDSTPLPVDASPEIVLKTASTRSDDTKSITNVCNNEQELTESFQGTLDTTIEAASANEEVSSPLQISGDQESVVSQLNAQEVQNDFVGNGSEQLLIDSVLPEKLDSTPLPVDASPEIVLKTASTRSDDTKSITNVCNNEQELTESFQGTLDTTIEAASANEKVCSPLQISGDQEAVVSQLNAQEVQNDFVGNGSEQLLIDSVLPEKLDSTPLPVDASPEIVLKTASTRSDDTKSITNVCNNEQELTESFQGTLDTTIEAASANEKVCSPLQISGDQESVVSQLNAQEVQNDFVANGSEQLLIDSVLPEKLYSTPSPVDASPEIVFKTASTRSDDPKSITNVCNNEQELTESFQGTLDTTIEAASANEKVCSPLQISGDQESVVSQLNAQEVQNDCVGNGSEQLLIDSVLPEKLDSPPLPVDASPEIVLKTASTRSDDTKSITSVCNNEQEIVLETASTRTELTKSNTNLFINEQELTESFQGTLDTTIEAASANEKVCSPLQISGDQESVVSQLNAQEVQNDFVGNGSEQLLIDSVLPEKLDSTPSPVDASPEIVLKTVSTRSDDTKSITSVCNNEQEIVLETASTRTELTKSNTNLFINEQGSTPGFQAVHDSVNNTVTVTEKIGSPLPTSNDQEKDLSHHNSWEIQSDCNNGNDQIPIDSGLSEKPFNTDSLSVGSSEIVLGTGSLKNGQTESQINSFNNELELTDRYDDTHNKLIKATTATDLTLPNSLEQQKTISHLSSQEVQNNYAYNSRNPTSINYESPIKGLFAEVGSFSDASQEIILETASVRNEQEFRFSSVDNCDPDIETATATEKVSLPSSSSFDQEKATSNLVFQDLQNNYTNTRSDELSVDSGLSEKHSETGSDTSPEIEPASTKDDQTKSNTNSSKNVKELTVSFQDTHDPATEAATTTEKVHSTSPTLDDQEEAVSLHNSQDIKNNYTNNRNDELSVDSGLSEKLSETASDTSPEIEPASTEDDQTESNINSSKNVKKLTVCFQDTHDPATEAATATEKVHSTSPTLDDQEEAVSHHNSQDVQNNYTNNRSDELSVDYGLTEKLSETGSDTSPEIEPASTEDDQTESNTNSSKNVKELTVCFQDTHDPATEAATATEKVHSTSPTLDDQEEAVSHHNSQDVQNNYTNNRSDELSVDYGLTEKLSETGSDNSPEIEPASTEEDQTESNSNSSKNVKELTVSIQDTRDPATATEKVHSTSPTLDDQEEAVSHHNSQDVQNNYTNNRSDELSVDYGLTEKLSETGSDTSPEIEPASTEDDQTESNTNSSKNVKELTVSFQDTHDPATEASTATEKVHSTSPTLDDQVKVVSHHNSQDKQNNFTISRSDQFSVDSGVSEKNSGTGSNLEVVLLSNSDTLLPAEDHKLTVSEQSFNSFEREEKQNDSSPPVSSEQSSSNLNDVDEQRDDSERLSPRHTSDCSIGLCENFRYPLNWVQEVYKPKFSKINGNKQTNRNKEKTNNSPKDVSPSINQNNYSGSSYEHEVSSPTSKAQVEKCEKNKRITPSIKKYSKNKHILKSKNISKILKNVGTMIKTADKSNIDEEVQPVLMKMVSNCQGSVVKIAKTSDANAVKKEFKTRVAAKHHLPTIAAKNANGDNIRKPKQFEKPKPGNKTIEINIDGEIISLDKSHSHNNVLSKDSKVSPKDASRSRSIQEHQATSFRPIKKPTKHKHDSCDDEPPTKVARFQNQGEPQTVTDKNSKGATSGSVLSNRLRKTSGDTTLPPKKINDRPYCGKNTRPGIIPKNVGKRTEVSNEGESSRSPLNRLNTNPSCVLLENINNIKSITKLLLESALKTVYLSSSTYKIVAQSVRDNEIIYRDRSNKKMRVCVRHRGPPQADVALDLEHVCGHGKESIMKIQTVEAPANEDIPLATTSNSSRTSSSTPDASTSSGASCTDNSSVPIRDSQLQPIKSKPPQKPRKRPSTNVRQDKPKCAKSGEISSIEERVLACRTDCTLLNELPGNMPFIGTEHPRESDMSSNTNLLQPNTNSLQPNHNSALKNDSQHSVQSTTTHLSQTAIHSPIHSPPPIRLSLPSNKHLKKSDPYDTSNEACNANIASEENNSDDDLLGFHPCLRHSLSLNSKVIPGCPCDPNTSLDLIRSYKKKLDLLKNPKNCSPINSSRKKTNDSGSISNSLPNHHGCDPGSEQSTRPSGIIFPSIDNESDVNYYTRIKSPQKKHKVKRKAPRDNVFLCHTGPKCTDECRKKRLQVFLDSMTHTSRAYFTSSSQPQRTDRAEKRHSFDSQIPAPVNEPPLIDILQPGPSGLNRNVPPKPPPPDDPNECSGRADCHCYDCQEDFDPHDRRR